MAGPLVLNYRTCIQGAVICWFTLGASILVSAEELLLRDLTLLTNRQIESFDLEGVRLKDGRLLTWDQIETADVSADRQRALDDFLEQVGDPLFRIHQRLKFEDYTELLAPADQLYARYRDQENFSGYVVTQAAMWSRIANGQRELAVEPYLRAYSYLRDHQEDYGRLPGPRRLSFSPQTGLSLSLTPIWFDAQQAGNVLDGVYAAFKEMQHPRPVGAYCYVASLAITAENFEVADAIIDAMEGDNRPTTELRTILQLQRDSAEGVQGTAYRNAKNGIDGFLPQHRALALYWMGITDIKREDRRTAQQGVLNLLRIVANFGQFDRELSAAALYHCSKTLGSWGDVQGSRALAAELMSAFPQTHFGLVLERDGLDAA